MKQSNQQSIPSIPDSAEERIIQYMDGELTDSESAELLHRASVSPEIRQLLADHEQLAQLSQRAVVGTSIPPALEERVLAHVGQLAEAANRSAGVAFWNQSWVRVSAVLLLLGASVTAYVLNQTGDVKSPIDKLAQSAPSQQHAIAASPSTNSGHLANLPVDQIKIAPRVFAEQQIAPRAIRSSATDVATRVLDVRHIKSADLKIPDNVIRSGIVRPHTFEPTHVADVPHQNVVPAASTDQMIASFGTVHSRNVLIASAFVPRESTKDLAHIHSLEFDRAPSLSNFELGLQTSSGFSYPASGPNVHPFADFRANLTYFLGDQDVVGLRVTSGLFQTSPGIIRTTTSSATIIRSDVSEQRQLAEEIFYGHRFVLSPQSGLALETAIGGGLIPQGNTISLELGFKLPFGEHFTGTAGFSLMRIHSTAPLMRDVIANELSNSGETPVIFQGSDIRNTLNGRLQYGFAYRF